MYFGGLFIFSRQLLIFVIERIKHNREIKKGYFPRKK